MKTNSDDNSPCPVPLWSARCLPLCSIAAAMWLGTVSAPAAWVVTWDTLPPGSDQWFLFQPGGGPSGNGDVPADWHASGGWNSSGYVSTALAATGEWESTPGVWYPLYSYAQYHPLYLSATPLISLATRDLSGLGGANLHGGSLRLWIGNFTDQDGPGGSPPELSFYYFNLQTIDLAAAWTNRSLQVSLNSGAWTSFGPAPAMPVSALFDNPQQWGIGIFGAQSAPSGTLGFDQFSAQIPEPGSAVMASFAAMLLSRRRRRKVSAGA